ncbi:hypothetical protein ABZ470_26945 [Streptosporangium sp. NPDC020072]|uniref:hypothetical protein n=1 Tax=Streptosporangium sp. NPDC020072 TaxID=3154788 RepID=UPI0034424A18
MALDNRKVQTAVLDDPRSEDPLSLPEDHYYAKPYLRQYEGRTFWCGEWLGGCGWRLMGKVYKDRVCHFAHYPDTDGRAPTCERRYVGADSADHLYIHRGLSGAFRDARPQRFQGNMSDGQCTDLTVNEPKGRSLIRVQLANLTPEGWTEADRALRRGVRDVEWMFGPRATRTARDLVDRNGYALRVRCDMEDGARVVKVGTETRDGDLFWNDLSECEISERGIVTPVLRDVRLKPHRRTTGPVDLPQAQTEAANRVTQARTVSMRMVLRDEEWVHASLIPLTGQLRKARSARDVEEVARLLGEVYHLLAVDDRQALLRLPRFRRRWQEIDEWKRWVLDQRRAKISSAPACRVGVDPKKAAPARPKAKKQRTLPPQRADRVGQEENRAQLHDLLEQVKSARRKGEVALMVDLLSTAGKVVATAPASDLKSERKQIESYKKWLETFSGWKAAADQAAAVDPPTREVGSRRIAGADTKRWQASEPKTAKNGFAERRGRIFASARTVGLVNGVRRLLTGVAQEQATVDWKQVMDRVATESAFQEPVDWPAVLVAVDTPAVEVIPMLSALITLPGGGVDPVFRQVLKGLGFQVPSTDEELRMVWEREVERVHARYAKPSRSMPPRLVPRQD